MSLDIYPREINSASHKNCPWLFITVLCIMALSWNQLHCPSAADRMHRLWRTFICRMGHHSATRCNKMMTLATHRMNLKSVVQWKKPLESLHALWFHACNIMEKLQLWRKNMKHWLPGTGNRGRYQLQRGTHNIYITMMKLKSSQGWKLITWQDNYFLKYDVDRPQDTRVWSPILGSGCFLSTDGITPSQN